MESAQWLRHTAAELPIGWTVDMEVYIVTSSSFERCSPCDVPAETTWTIPKLLWNSGLSLSGLVFPHTSLVTQRWAPQTKYDNMSSSSYTGDMQGKLYRQPALVYKLITILRRQYYTNCWLVGRKHIPWEESSSDGAQSHQRRQYYVVLSSQNRN